MLEPGCFVELRDGCILRVNDTDPNIRKFLSVEFSGRVYIRRTELPASRSSQMPPPRLGLGSHELHNSLQTRYFSLCDVVCTCYVLTWAGALSVPGGPTAWVSFPRHYIMGDAMPTTCTKSAVAPAAKCRPRVRRGWVPMGRPLFVEESRRFFSACVLSDGSLLQMADHVMIDAGPAVFPYIARIQTIVEVEEPGSPAPLLVGVRWLVKPSEILRVPVACRPCELFQSPEGDYEPVERVLRKCEIAVVSQDLVDYASMWALHAPVGVYRFFTSRWFDSTKSQITDCRPEVVAAREAPTMPIGPTVLPDAWTRVKSTRARTTTTTEPVESDNEVIIINSPHEPPAKRPRMAESATATAVSTETAGMKLVGSCH
eukprot:m51a1_g12829 hypothetical protein (372) ;mRNA; r:617-1732